MKKTVTSFFVLVMVLALAACGGGGSAPPDPGPSTPGGAASPGGSTATPGGTPTTPAGNTGTEATTQARYTSQEMDGAPSPDAKYGGHFKFVPRPATSMTKPLGLPWDHQIGGAVSLLNPFCETLLLENFTVEGGFAGWLAESWTLDMDNDEVVFHLREGVKFSDGSPFNAEVVVWNIDRGIESRQLNPSVVGAEVRGEYDVAVLMDEFSYFVLWTFATRPFGVISMENYEKNGKEFAEMNPVGTGPFVLQEWQTGVGASFVKNEDYWIEGRPYIDSIEYIAMTESLVQTAAMQDTGINSIDLLITSDVQQMQLLEQTAPATVFKLPVGPTCLYPSSKNEDSPFAKLEVRQAISYALNRDEIVEARGFGVLTPEYQFLPDMPGVPGRLPEAPYRLDFDPAKGRELLAQAGYPNGFSTTYYNSTSGERDIPLIIQEQLRAIGINATMEFLEGGALTEMRGVTGWEGLTNGSIRVFTNLFRTFNLNVDSEYQYNISIWRPVDEMRPVYQRAMALPYVDPESATELNRLLMDNLCVIPVYVSYDGFVTKDYVRDTGIGDYGQGNDWMVSSVWLDK